MIVRERTHWFKMLFMFRGTVILKIWPQLLFITVFSIAVLLFQGKIYEYKVNLNPTIFTLIGVALAIFLGFCNTASYDRFCLLLPFGLVDVVGWMMPVLVTFINYTFISLEAIVSEIGEPFGQEANDLALNSICRTIEFSLFDLAAIEQPPMQPQKGYFID